MKINRIVSLVLALILILSCSMTTFTKVYFYKDFDTCEEMNSFVAKYSADFPNVEYSDVPMNASAKYYALKYKDFLQVGINDPEYNITGIRLDESNVDQGVDVTYLNYEHSSGYYEVDISVTYYLSEESVMGNLENMDAYLWPDMYSGEVNGYPYVAGENCDEFGNDEECLYKIAVGDVLVMVSTNFFYDKSFIEKLTIEKTGITLPVYEKVVQKPIEVSDEMLLAVRTLRNNNSYEKSDIHITDLDVISDTKQFVRYSVYGDAYSCEVVYQYIGDYGFCVPQRPLPKVLCEGSLYELKEAYEKGIVTDEDLAVISTFESKHYTLKHKNEFIGDITGDLTLDIYDATTIQRCLASLDEISHHRGEDYADFNGDGVVSIFDATGIQMKLAKIK